MLLVGALTSLGASSPAGLAALEPGTSVAVASEVPSHGRAWELVTPPEVNTAWFRSVVGISTSGKRIAYRAGGKLPDSPKSESLYSTNVATRGADGWTNAPVMGPHFELFPRLRGFDPSIENSLWTGRIPSDLGALGTETAIYREGSGGEFTQLSLGDEFFGSSTDLQHVFFAADEHLLPVDAARTSGRSLYESFGSTLRLVDVNNDGSLISDCGIKDDELATRTSTDGRRIFFAVEPSCAGPQRIYLRADGATTTEISASQCDLPDCGPVANVTLAGATPSGSVAFLSTAQRLTNEDSDSSTDIYRYDVASGDLSLIPFGDADNLTDRVVASTDGSRVYFMDRSETRLYLSDGSGVHQIGTDGVSGYFETTPDGRYALFVTASPLTASDGDESADVYRYDAVDGSVTEISVGGNGAFSAAILEGENLDYRLGNRYRAMSDDGSRIFFATAERLLPEDHNDVEDVYEWVNGDLGLISSGTGTWGTSYLGSTADGATALLLTAQALLPNDRDGGDLDLYAARIGGGFPEPPAPGCVGDPCQVPARERIARAIPRSARASAKRIRIGRIGAVARRQIVATGWIVLLAEVPRGGRLTAAARARLGSGAETVAAAGTKVAGAGTARLRMRLSKGARRELAAGHDLHLDVLLRLADLHRRLGIELEGKR
jgi:hypothetical protein